MGRSSSRTSNARGADVAERQRGAGSADGPLWTDTKGVTKWRKDRRSRRSNRRNRRRTRGCSAETSCCATRAKHDARGGVRRASPFGTSPPIPHGTPNDRSRREGVGCRPSGSWNGASISSSGEKARKRSLEPSSFKESPRFPEPGRCLVVCASDPVCPRYARAKHGYVSRA
jgi:hypothetical protein